MPGEWGAGRERVNTRAAFAGFALSALLDGNVSARIVTQINLARTRDFLFGIEQHFLPLRDPAGSARNREQNRKHGHGKAHRLIDQSRIEIHVGIELALDEVFVLESDAFAFKSDLEQRILAHEIKDFVGDALDNAGARIVVLIDAVAEAHQLHFARFYPLDEIGNLSYRADF